ncbi:GAF domain-containing protein [Actinomadura sp. NPDC023710]|uniref:GAF domain-containing protein n=1 Tax=Actinomadura sp. NPDC023710 TaxID=3158219 RepID=UPI0033EC3E08
MQANYDTYLRLHAPDRAVQDAAIRRRTGLLTGLGLDSLEQEEEFDAFATDVSQGFAAALGRVAQGLYAMVNLIGQEQVFVGLHNPPGKRPVGRTMSRDHGYCPAVIDRGLPLVLSDVLAAPRFASNHVVDAIGIRTYAGTPLIHQDTGIAFGTLCVIGDHQLPEETEDAALALIKAGGARLMQLIEQRTTVPELGPPADDATSATGPTVMTQILPSTDRP